MYKKRSSSKLYFAIILVIIIAVSVAAAVYVTQFNKPAAAKVGVHVGDTFTYTLTGESVLGSVDAVTPAYLSEYNDTDYYQITITAVIGTNVSFNTVWRFTNGTEITSPQILDISSGNKSDANGFWAIYPSNLKVSDLLRPTGYDEQIVNATSSTAYGAISRPTNFWQIESQFTDANDPTGNTMRDDYIGLYFDQQTGMLTSLENVQRYNNPQYNIIIIWQLTSSSVWAVQ